VGAGDCEEEAGGEQRKAGEEGAPEVGGVRHRVGRVFPWEMSDEGYGGEWELD
jgi:hypothetical protein